MNYSLILYITVAYMIYYYLYHIPKLETRTLTSDVKPQKIKQKNTKFGRFLLLAFAEKKGSFKIVSIYRKLGFLFTLFMGLILIFILNGNYTVANILLCCLFTLIIILSVIRKALVFAVQRYSGVKLFGKSFANAKNTVRKISKQDFKVYYPELDQYVALKKKLTKYCYTKEKGIFYLQYKDLERIKNKELKKYKKFDHKIEPDEKGKPVFKVLDKRNGDIIFQAPLK